MISEIYHFMQYRGSTLVNEWHYTSADIAVSYGGDTYEPRAMGRTAIPLKRELSRNNIEVRFAIDDSFASEFGDDIEHTRLDLVIYEYDDPDATQIFTGSLSEFGIENEKTFLKFETGFAFLRETGPRNVFGRNCPVALYSDECGAIKSSFEVAATATSILGNQLTVPGISSYDDGYFTHGTIEDEQGTEMFITAHSGTIVTVQVVTPYVESEMASSGSTDVSLYPGCQKNLFVCEGRFSNAINFRNYPGIPWTNPFEG